MLLPRILKRHEYWLRLTALLYYYQDNLYHKILHRTAKLPTDPKKLYEELIKKQHHIKHFLKRQKITQEQFDLIYPETGKTNIYKFDIGTFVFVVRHFTNLKPKGGWVLVNRLQRGDKSKGAFLVELESFIKENLEFNEPIMFHRFDEDWAELTYILKGLKMDTKTCQGLKKCQISRTYVPPEYTGAIMKAQFEFIKSNHRMNTVAIQNLAIDDVEDENKAAIFSLQNQNSKIEELIGLLDTFINSKNVSWQAIFEKLSEIDKLLVDLKNDTDFLKEMVHLDHDVVDAGVVANAGEEPDIEARICVAMKKLKATYAYALSKDQHLSESSCCSQPYTKLELLCKHVVKTRSENHATGETTRKEIYRETNIGVDDMLKVNNYVILRGISGIGKTYTIREIATEWAHSSIFDDIKFLFILNFTELQVKNFENLEKVLQHFYPHIFEVITYAEIISKPDQMLLIIDGWVQQDGFKYTLVNEHELSNSFEETDEKQYKEFDIFTSISDAVHQNGDLFSQKLIITTHPENYQLLSQCFKNISFTTVDVVGFSEDGVCNYIMNYFTNQKQLLKNLHATINDNESLRHMIKIPSNLYTLCFIQKTLMYLPNQYDLMTELYLSKLVELLHEWNNDTSSVADAFPVVVSAIIEASNLSYHDQMSREDSSNNLNDYNIQNFLISIYLFMKNSSPSEILKDDRLKTCLPFVAGLHGLQEPSSSSPLGITENFINCLNISQNKSFINQLFQIYLNPSKKQKEKVFGTDFLLFLQSYHEFHGKLAHSNSLKCITLSFVLHNMLPSDLSNLIYFLNEERDQLHIQSFDLHTHQPITNQQMQQLAIHLLKTPRVKIDVKMMDNVSETFTNVIQQHQGIEDFRIELNDLELCEKNILEKHVNISFTWLVEFQTLHLYLNTSQVSSLMKNLKEAIPYALEKKIPIQLFNLELSVPATYEKLTTTIQILISNFIYLNRIHVKLTKEPGHYEYRHPYQDHKPEHKSIEGTDMYTIKQALYTALKESSVTRNLQRLKISSKASSYEFIINNATKQISCVLDNDDDCYVDVELFHY